MTAPEDDSPRPQDPGSTGGTGGTGGTGTLLWRAGNRWQAALRRALRPFGLTHVQFVLLDGLAATDPGIALSQADLADRVGTDPMMTSQVLRALESAGLVLRSPHPGDRRARLLSITPEGAALLGRSRGAVAEADRAFFAVLGADSALLPALLGRLG